MDMDRNVVGRAYQLSKGNPIEDTMDIMALLQKQIEDQGCTLEVLGVGGMSDVFKARDVASYGSPIVAVKVLNESFSSRPESLIALHIVSPRYVRAQRPHRGSVHKGIFAGQGFPAGITCRSSFIRNIGALAGVIAAPEEQAAGRGLSRRILPLGGTG